MTFPFRPFLYSYSTRLTNTTALLNNLKAMGYCPSIEEDICEKYDCDDEEAMSMKRYLHERCIRRKQEQKISRLKVSRPAPDTVVLPEHIRPESYVIWLWIKKEPKIIGNATITVNVLSTTTIKSTTIRYDYDIKIKI